MSIVSEQKPRKFRRAVFFRTIILITAIVATFAALVLPLALRPTALPLAVGDVAPRDMQAPYTIDYTSEIRTEEARQIAASNISLVYTPADPIVAQIHLLRPANRNF